MITKKKIFGTVSWPPNHQAYYVRVSVPSWDNDSPLSIKATFSKFDRRDFSKGDTVEIARSDPRDARRYEVLRLMKMVEPKEPVVHGVVAGQFPSTKGKSMSQDKGHIRFFLPFRYFQTRRTTNGMTRDTCVKILNAVFGAPEGPGSSWSSQMTAHTDGFWIVCRPSQFARFIVYRYDADECINGIKDLKPEMVPFNSEPTICDSYDRLATAAGVTCEQAKRVSLALCYNFPSQAKKALFNVSRNFS